MLGYTGVQNYRIYDFNTTNGIIWLDGLNCTGTEMSIANCSHVGWGRAVRCYHRFNVGVTCKMDNRAAVEVRLMDGKTAHDGRVEVRTKNGQWSTICNKYWDLLDAYVVCRMLNFSKALSAGTASVNGSGPIYPNWLNCYGYETSIEQCRQASVSCNHSRDTAVVCGNFTSEENAITVRLVGTNVSHVGQVEIQYNGTWGTVCDYNWDIRDSHVICRMLGYKAAERPIWWIEGETTTRILMNYVQCSGKEQSIAECAHSGWWTDYCKYKYLAGVVCQVDEGKKDKHHFIIRRLRWTCHQGRTTSNPKDNLRAKIKERQHSSHIRISKEGQRVLRQQKY
ncbi:hypothetical protein QZH41_018739 [Actinostola sp. cb2023]|nr:hypothetical protein QZH41_018739 [Actinostola sp. cb2023]